MTVRLQKNLKDLKQGLARLYGDNLDSATPYGSQAPGDPSRQPKREEEVLRMY